MNLFLTTVPLFASTPTLAQARRVKHSAKTFDVYALVSPEVIDPAVAANTLVD